jgi:hypothetical protein
MTWNGLLHINDEIAEILLTVMIWNALLLITDEIAEILFTDSDRQVITSERYFSYLVGNMQQSISGQYQWTVFQLSRR